MSFPAWKIFARRTPHRVCLNVHENCTKDECRRHVYGLYMISLLMVYPGNSMGFVGVHQETTREQIKSNKVPSLAESEEN
ncbi:hypothetical protein BDQ12DRAFT_694278 [Crucibulum laeve]|uniref:Uncharacterized protein n=1 Tax=Crucibulum laeve TaxID=68775 RepID=A0A5C3LF27_9AGAR|nr:hypothetical protein BDQ12DRAFT_694278 [Crucibulum laeve]